MGVLAAVGIFAYNKYIQSSQKATNEANAKSLADALSAEASSPNICNGLDANQNPTNLNYPGGVLNSSSPTQGFWDGTSIVACANKILVQNSFVNPYTQIVYGGPGNINPPNTDTSNPTLPPKFQFQGNNFASNQSVAQSTNAALGIDIGSDTTALIMDQLQGFSNIIPSIMSGPIYCSDQLNGNSVTYHTVDNSSWSAYNSTPPAGLVLVAHGGPTVRFGVATCDPYTGTIGAIFDITSPF